MSRHFHRIAGIALAWPLPLLAADTSASVGDSLARMVAGTLVVLCIIGVLAWLARRVMPGQGLSGQGVIKQVGGLALSPRERVVVLEVGGHWLVVGLSGGQMSALGELPVPQAADSDSSMTAETTKPVVISPEAPFSQRLQQAMQQTLQQAVKGFNNKP